jgi:hypothetical protein
MKKYSLALLAAAAAIAIAPAAFADTFDLKINSSTFNANLVLTGDSVSAGEYRINGVSGTYQVTGEAQQNIAPGTASVPSAGGATSSSLALSPDQRWLFDNLLYYPTTTPEQGLDWGGILFTDNAGVELNLFSNQINHFFFGDFGPGTNHYGNYEIDATSASLTKTPEPSSLLLLGTAMLGLAFVAFRKSRNSTPVFGNLA